MKVDEKLVPELRSPEFKGEWSTLTLSDITKINQGLQIAISNRYTEPVEGGYFYITNEFLRKNSQKQYYIKNPPKSVICNEDDILMTRTGNTGEVVTGVFGAFHNNFFKIAYSSECSKWFLYYFLTSHKTQHTILKLAGTSTIPDLNHGDFYKIRINLPTLPEQQKIASFLSAIDKKIEKLTRKKELLQEYKKGVMQKIFSQEIRFKDDDGNVFPAWEEKRLGEMLLLKSRPFKMVDTKAYSLVTVKRRYGGIVCRGILKGEEIKVKSQFIINENDFLISKRQISHNACGLVPKELEGSIVSNEYSVFIPKANLNIFYFNYFCQLPKVSHKFFLSSIGVHIEKMLFKADDWLKWKFDFPTIIEQQKIASFVSNIDNKIESVEAQLTQTQTFKKGLLQKMFV